jgi:predicted amidohydrolase
MKVAAAQMPAVTCYDGNPIDHLRDRVRECERGGVSLLCCPEGALGGLADYIDAPDAIAVPRGGNSLAQLLAPLASDTVTTIVGFTERDVAGYYYNAAAVFSRGSVLGVYRKQHPAMRRSRYSPGTETPVFIAPGLTIGILICRDSVDIDLAARLVQQGAQVLCIPTNNAMPPDRGGPHLIDEIRGLDTQCATTFGVPVVRADVIGAFRGLTSVGGSMVSAPGQRQMRARGAPDGELIVSSIAAVYAEGLSASRR